MKNKKSLLLHIGHGKTGSSFLQTCFASSINALDEAGIDYPIDKAALQMAQNGQTTEGNFPPISFALGHSIDALKALVGRVPEKSEQRVLISNEGLFQSILLHDFLSQIVSAFPEYEIRILLFIRDPLDHLISAYQELLKEDIVGDIEELFKVTSVPMHVNLALNKAAELGVSIDVYNFDRHRDELKEVAEDWLGLKTDTLRSGLRQLVNRSMDRSEILIQRAFNKHVGNKARQFIADALVGELPLIKARKPFIDHAVLADFIQSMHRDAPQVNARIRESEHYRVPSFDEAAAMLPSEKEAQKIELSLEQLDVLAFNISKFLPAHWKKN